MQRRQFLQSVGRAVAAGVGVLGGWAGSGCRTPRSGAAGGVRGFELDDVSVAALRGGLRAGRFTARQLTAAYLRRIDEIDAHGPALRSVLEVNPDAEAMARALDEEWRRAGPRGPWHGIPVLLKDNIATGDRMHTTAGSLALAGSRAPRDSFIAARLRAAGAVLLGKTNLSEWANFRGARSLSGWSAIGGQTRNPYCLACNPSGSSSGSAAAVAASLCAVAVGTETNGSIVSPSAYCGIVGIKPTVGLVSRTGIIPISSSQDTAGPMGRTVADAAALLNVLAGVDPQDAATAAAPGQPGAGGARVDYETFLVSGALAGARLGVPRTLFQMHRRIDPIFARVLDRLQAAGAELIEPIALPSRQDLGGADYQVMLYEFKAGLNAYLRALGGSAPVSSLGELIAYNEGKRDRELRFFGQETLVEAEKKGALTEAAYLEAKERCGRWSQRLGALLADQRLDAVVAPTSGPAHVIDYVHGDRGMGGSSTYAAVSGFPNVTVPCGSFEGLPLGISFFGPKWSEGRLIALAHSFEISGPARLRPTFAPTLDELLARQAGRGLGGCGSTGPATAMHV